MAMSLVRAPSLLATMDLLGLSGESWKPWRTHGEETEDGRLVVVVDLIEEARPPFDPIAVAREFAALLMVYRVRVVTGDRCARPR